jgi:hypothetical protein
MGRKFGFPGKKLIPWQLSVDDYAQAHPELKILSMLRLLYNKGGEYGLARPY